MEFERGDIDLVLRPQRSTYRRTIPAQLLFEEQHVVVGPGRNPLLRKPLTVADFLGSAHVGVTIGPVSAIDLRRTAPAVAGCREDGRNLCATFSPSCPGLTDRHPASDRMHERLARVFADGPAINSIQALPIRYHRCAKCSSTN